MIDSGLWWVFLALSPVLYWALPLAVRAYSLALMSFALLMYYAPADIATLAALASAIYVAHAAPDTGNRIVRMVSGIGKSSWPLVIVLAYFF